MIPFRLLLMIPLMLTGCGYALVGRGNFLPPDARTIQVQPFVNRTTRVELEQRLTQQVGEELVSRSRLRLASSAADADLILKGSIDSFGVSHVGFDSQGRATQHQAAVTAKIELLDHRNGDKVLWKNEQFRFTETFPVSVESGNPLDQESRAIVEIARRFSEALVASLLEGF